MLLHCACCMSMLGCVQEVEATDEAAIYERALWDRLPLPSW